MVAICWRYFPLVAYNAPGRRWLQFTANIRRAPNTIDAYRRALEDHLGFCKSAGVDPRAVRSYCSHPLHSGTSRIIREYPQADGAWRPPVDSRVPHGVHPQWDA